MRPDVAAAIRARLIATLEQRAAGVDGEARRALETRLAAWRARDADTPRASEEAAPPRTPLRELLDHFAGEPSPERTAYPDVPALDDFRKLWADLRADARLQQSVADVPADAGPLNSAALASRAIALMRELSPDYLRSFLAYVDDLAWLDHLGSSGPASGSATPAAKKRARRKRPA